MSLSLSVLSKYRWYSVQMRATRGRAATRRVHPHPSDELSGMKREHFGIKDRANGRGEDVSEGERSSDWAGLKKRAVYQTLRQRLRRNMLQKRDGKSTRLTGNMGGGSTGGNSG